MSAPMEVRTARVIVAPQGEPIFSELATIISIDDEPGGEFITVEQHGRDLGKIAIEVAEWPTIREVINDMIAQCRP